MQIVLIDAGKFDIPLFESETEFAADRFRDLVQPYCIYKLSVKNKARILRGRYATGDDILLDVEL